MSLDRMGGTKVSVPKVSLSHPALGAKANSMSWRNLAYGSQQAADAAPAVAPTKAVTKEAVVSQGKRSGLRRRPSIHAGLAH